MVVDYSKIDNERRLQRFTQPEFSEKIGMSLQGYLRMMKLQTITALQLFKICEVLNKNVQYFVINDLNTVQVNEPAAGYAKATTVKDNLEMIRKLVDEIDNQL